MQLPVAESHLFRDLADAAVTETSVSLAESGDDFHGVPAPLIGLTCNRQSLVIAIPPGLNFQSRDPGLRNV